MKNKIHQLMLTFAFFSVFSIASAQGDLSSFNQNRNRLNQKGMMVLGSWALGNFIVGSIGWSRGSGSNMYFHQGNVLWNTVNMGLAGAGLYSSLRFNSDLSLAQSIIEQSKLEKIFLFNAGLDVGYMAFGMYLKERSKNAVNRADMFEGYGNALLLQGGFLFVFDLVMYVIHHSHNKNLIKILDGVRLSSNGIGFGYIF